MFGTRPTWAKWIALVRRTLGCREEVCLRREDLVRRTVPVVSMAEMARLDLTGF